MPKYITYEEPYKGKVFTLREMHELYLNDVDKVEYSDFQCWFEDMLKSGVFEDYIENE